MNIFQLMGATELFALLGKPADKHLGLSKLIFLIEL